MLLREVHIPCLYSELPQAEESRPLYYSSVERVLQDALRNCVLLMDDRRTILSQVESALESWPGAYRKRAKELLRQLSKRKRLIYTHADSGDRGVAGHTGCRMALRLADRQKPEMLLCPKACPSCVESGPEGIHLDEYEQSRFCEERRQGEAVQIQDGEWRRDQFEDRVLNPLFRDAKHVKIFDAHIGRTVLSDPDAPRLLDTYSNTLTWIVACFADMTRGRQGRTFEITCGVDERKGMDIGHVAVDLLEQFAQQMSSRYDCPISMIVKLEGKGGHMPHDRYLFTDQIALHVSRGFDLLNWNGTLRDVSIFLVPNRGAIEEGIRRLPDAR